jgi:hypothetical protein
MAIEVYLGIRAAYVDTRAAEAMLDSVGRALASMKLKPIEDPDPAPALGEISRTKITVHTAAELQNLGDYAGEDRPHAQLLHSHPYRLVYVPRGFRMPLELDRQEDLGKKKLKVALGSSIALLRELSSFATDIDIPLTREGKLDDAEAKKWGTPPTGEDEPDIRHVWLTMLEAARLSTERDLPICLG